MHTHLTTREDVSIFRHILDLYLKPVIGGTELSGPFSDAEKPVSPAIFTEEGVVKIFMPNAVRIYFLIRKRGVFNASERNLIARFIEKLHGTAFGNDILPVSQDTSPAEMPKSSTSACFSANAC